MHYSLPHVGMSELKLTDSRARLGSFRLQNLGAVQRARGPSCSNINRVVYLGGHISRNILRVNVDNSLLLMSRGTSPLQHIFILKHSASPDSIVSVVWQTTYQLPKTASTISPSSSEKQAADLPIGSKQLLVAQHLPARCSQIVHLDAAAVAASSSEEDFSLPRK